MIYSLELNGNIPEADIWIIGDRLRKSDKDKIQACAKRKITFHDLDQGIIRHLAGLKTTSNWSRVAYARLFIPALMPVDRGNLLYLDADTMIKGSLRPLQEMDLSSKVIAAVGGPSKHNLPIGRAEEAFYFNSGVVLLNLKEWQRQELTLRALELLKRRTFGFPDQDVLNLIVEGQTVALEPMWNFDAKVASEEERIVHFTHAKPNTTYCLHPEKALFLEYRSETPWADARLKTKWDKRLNRLRHSLKRRFNVFRRLERAL